jgi:glycosyltransferase involved in cell wall biosynthesis
MGKGLKVVLVTAYFPPETKGGAEISTYLLARGLQEKGNDVSVITEGQAGTEELDGLNVYKVAAGLRDKPLDEKRKSRAIARALNSQKDLLEAANIVHANDFRSVLGLMEWRRMFQGSGAPIIATIRDYAVCSGSTNFITASGDLPADSIQDAYLSHRIAEVGGLRRWARLWQYRMNINYRKSKFSELDGEVYISRQQMEIISQQREESNVPRKVIYNPIADNFLSNNISDGYAGKILYVGTVENYKGVGLLLESWRQVAKMAPQATLKIVGEGTNRQEYETAVERAGLQYSIQIVGKVAWDQIIREFDQVRIVVAPHLWYEPFGRTVAEGMARGKVVVAANVGGPSEMIRPGETGLLFERKSAKALSHVLMRALQMHDLERQKMGKLAREWTKINLNKNSIASLYEDFYKEVITAYANKGKN